MDVSEERGHDVNGRRDVPEHSYLNIDNCENVRSAKFKMFYLQGKKTYCYQISFFKEILGTFI
jgi:hypothetical protein